MKSRLVLLLLLSTFIVNAQEKSNEKEYPSLLWEITGKGMKKPSYLFGTMHVSNKLAFQLSDSFYLGIRNADVVALETNPESWQEDMSRYDAGNNENSGRLRRDFVPYPEDYLTINTLKFFKYESKIERSLYSSPSTINNLLYRNYDRGNSDFEEDTYLDMYIYQCGKKWGKKVAGVERYDESMKLMAEAYRDAARDKNRKNRSFTRDEDYSPEKLQEAYRTGNLDLLDSINRFNSFSEAFDEKFLYKRNEIQAESIDSILQSRKSLFVGVGAAHLPGNRGVIAMLRSMGYSLRPIKMGQRDSQHKNSVEKIRVPVTFSTQAPEDSLFLVDIPGKFYKFGEDGSLDQHQYADMANGSYYMVTRIMTNAWMWGHSTAQVYQKVDSLLYENVPGKILTKTAISRNGYPGFAITNRTRRGDIQRYSIFITPYEVVFFKMSGTGEYVSKGDEAERFFNSIRFKPYSTDSQTTYSPPNGGFAATFPHRPYVGNDGSWIFDASDTSAGLNFRIVRSDIHNFEFTGEDTFDLSLMEESFAASEFIGKRLSREMTRHQGYPALESSFSDMLGNNYLARFIIRGPHYYSVIAHGKLGNERMRKFIDSFRLTAYSYGEAKLQTDTSLYFSVRTPVFPKEKEQLDMAAGDYTPGEDFEETEQESIKSGLFRSRIIANDTTGEKIFVSLFSTRRYFHTSDTNWVKNVIGKLDAEDTVRITRSLKHYALLNGTKVWEQVISDSGSSRAHWVKTYFRDGVGYRLITQIDTLAAPSSFQQGFFDSFTPADTLTGSDPFLPKSKHFLTDFMNKDSLIHHRAIKHLYDVRLDSSDLLLAKKAVASLDWKEKKYLETKRTLISRMNEIRTRAASDYFRELYFAAGDTLELQYISLETLLRQKTPYAFQVFRDIMINEPPVLGLRQNSYSGYRPPDAGSYYSPGIGYSNGNFLDDLFDSLPLTRTILPDILPLINLDDYEQPMMLLLGRMVDSQLVKPSDYQLYFSKFMIEARQELKKQRITEKNRDIRKAEENKQDEDNGSDNDRRDPGNNLLRLYSTLLLPFSRTQPAVDPWLYQVMNSSDDEVRYHAMLLLLRNKKQVPDSILVGFAGKDAYRYELFKDLKEIDKLDRFPRRYMTQLAIGRSMLMESKSYGKPDSLVYLMKLPAEVKGAKGFVYFFKYKTNKDDISWRIATAGLMPSDTTVMEIEVPVKYVARNNFSRQNIENSETDFTVFTDEKLGGDASQVEQFQKLLKRMVYSKRKSAKEFYEEAGNNRYDYAESIRY